MAQTLRNLSRKSQRLGHAVDQLRAKERFQAEQEEEASRQHGGSQAERASEEAFDVDHISSVKEHLANNGEAITSLVQKLNIIKSAVAF